MFSGVILPNESKKIPLTFASQNAGIFNETWELDTQPVLCGGDPIYVLLRGVATEEDKLVQQRKDLEVHGCFALRMVAREQLGGFSLSPRYRICSLVLSHRFVFIFWVRFSRF